MPKNTGKIQELTQQYMNGSKMKDILTNNPDVSRSTIYHHARQLKKGNEPVEQNHIEQNHIEQNHVEQLEPVENIQVEQNHIVHPPRVDSFLGSQRKKGTSKLSWSKEDKLDSLFGSMFDDKPSYDAKQLSSVQHKPEEKSMKSKSNSWWTKQPKTKKQQDTDQMLDTENERMKLVQQIRLYFTTFPELQTLHIVPKNKKTEKPELEKYLISLYTKKDVELIKVLNFVQFHCRNSVSENSSKVFENVAGTVVKFSEHLFIMCGLKVQGLTEQVMNDKDILRCIKEIQIESAISTFNYGPKTDLGIQLCSAITRLDTSNRIQERLQKQATKDKPENKPEVDVKINTKILNKYNDL